MCEGRTFRWSLWDKSVSSESKRITQLRCCRASLRCAFDSVPDGLEQQDGGLRDVDEGAIVRSNDICKHGNVIVKS